MAILSGVLTSDQYDALDKISSDSSNKSYKDAQTLDKDAFLKLMMTQLQYQDPLDPMDNTEYIAQMAQFSSVEQLANISGSMTTTNNLLMDVTAQMADLTNVIVAMDENITTANSDTSSEDVMILQNQSILQELQRLNDAINAYMGNTSDEDEVTDEAIMDAVSA
ncbi:MAG: flagellar basal-body rod modification protein FlgD [Clostridiales bacterium]|jgi:flagellar basal-body rod modification protein FlgD|nr:flagellar basal-body rod modification protein FlgD [Clostridiales bacterium]